MHLAQCGSLLSMEKRLGEPVHASCSVWIITFYGKRLGEELHASLSVWIIILFGYKARRAITCILLSVDHHFIWIQG